MKLSIEAPEDEVALPGEIHLHIRFRPANMFGILLALLVHGLLLYFLLHMNVLKKKLDKAGSSEPMVFIMDKVAKAPKQATAPQKQKAESKPVRVPPSKNAITRPKIPPPPVTDSPVAQPPPPQAKETPPEMDMMALANAARERRRAAEQAAAQENDGARQAGRGMTPQEVAEANVKRSMQQAANRGGGSGVFELGTVGTRVASFTFRGWNTRVIASNGKQSFEVDACSSAPHDRNHTYGIQGRLQLGIPPAGPRDRQVSPARRFCRAGKLLAERVFPLISLNFC
jgi:outer membrane biosynthesis protein TonB